MTTAERLPDLLGTWNLTCLLCASASPPTAFVTQDAATIMQHLISAHAADKTALRLAMMNPMPDPSNPGTHYQFQVAGDGTPCIDALVAPGS